MEKGNERPFVQGLTVDSPTSRDLDDAIWVEKRDDGWNVVVSIADVSTAVPKGSPDDREAYQRAFTRYFATGNRPMLPRDLADNKLSLLPYGGPRATITFAMELNRALDVKKIDIKRTKIRSKEKMTHAQVDAILDSTSDKRHRWWADCFELAQGLLQKRRDMGALAIFDLKKGLATNEEGVVVPLPSGKNYRAYLIIQELMILVNHAVTKHLLDEGVTLLIRNHTTREEGEHRERFVRQLGELLVEVTPELLDRLGSELKRLTERARYAAENKGHFGLNLDCYTHWTSPIRRYADLVNHRILIAWMEGAKMPYSPEEIEEIGSYLNARSDEERDKTKEGYKARIVHKLSRAGNEQLAKLPDGEFGVFLKKITDETIPLTPGRANVISTRIRQGALDIADISRILFAQFRGSLWTELKEDALRWLEHNKAHSHQLFELAHVLHGWPSRDSLQWEYDSKGPDNAVQHIACVSLRHDEETYRSESFQGPQRRDIEHEAVFDLLCKVVGITYEPQQKGDDMDDATITANPKGQLLELAQRLKVAPPEFAMKSLGNPHAPVFSCTGTFVIEGQEFTGESNGTSKKAAEKVASILILSLIPDKYLDWKDEKGSGQTAPENQNPVSALLEWAQKNRQPLPEFTYRRSGEPHTPIFASICTMVISGQTKQWEGVGASKKAAKSDAAKKARQELCSS